jgi:N-acetylmuramoyl-L-alanine amidase
MNALILFVIKSIVVSGILSAWYLLALKNKPLHHYNRFYLLLTLGASMLIPLLSFKWSPILQKTPILLQSVQALAHTVSDADGAHLVTLQAPAAGISWSFIVVAVAALISILLVARLLTQIVWVLHLASQFPNTVVEQITVVQTNLPKAPFSFLNRIYWRDTLPMHTDSGKMILRHELAHIRQKHTYDKLVCQLLTSIFWINPFYWIIQKELEMVHEFIADEQAVAHNSEGTSGQDTTVAFAKMLLHAHNPSINFSPEHQFFASPIKRRLTMLQTNNTVRASLLRRSAVLPLIAGTILIFAFSPPKATKFLGIKSNKKIVLVVDASHGGTDLGCRSGSLTEKDLSLKVAKRILQLAPSYNIEVHLTRTDDRQMTLDERLDFSNKLQPDDLLSIHVDDKPGKEIGKGTFDIAINNKNAKATESSKLAYAILKHASRPEWEQTNALAERNPKILGGSTSAAALIEIGDIKNKNQMQHITDETKLDELCSHILEGVVEAHNN